MSGESNSHLHKTRLDSRRRRLREMLPTVKMHEYSVATAFFLVLLTHARAAVQPEEEKHVAFGEPQFSAGASDKRR